MTTDTLTAGLECETESVRMVDALADARARPHLYRLPHRTREMYLDDFRTLKSLGCHGPLVAAIARALALDKEARNA